MKKLLLKTYDFFQQRKALLYVITTGLFVLLGILASRVKIEEDIARMMPNGKQTEQINHIFRYSRFADKIIVKISGKGNTEPDTLIELADSFVNKLSTYKNYIAEIKSKVDDAATFEIYNTVHNNIPIYLDESDYKAIDTLISPEHVHTALENDYKVLTSASGIVLKKIIADDPISISTIALKKLKSLQIDENYELYDGYIMTKDRKSVMIFITPVNPSGETSKNALFIKGIDEIIASLNPSAKNAEIDYYGGTVVAVGNANQLKKDTVLTLSITVVMLILFIGFFFRRKRVPFIMMLPVIFGGLFAIALIMFIRGSISSIALGAGSIVLGIAINYSLHFFSHYKHCGSIKETIADLLVPMTLGSATTVGSFFSLMLLKSQILNDFGLFAGLSLTGATIFSLVFLPHFIPLQKFNSADVAHESWFSKLPKINGKYSGVLAGIILIITVFLFPYALNIGFESDMSHLNFLTPQLKKAEKKIDIMQNDTSKTVFIATIGNNPEEVLRNNELLLMQLDTATKRGWVKKYSSISSFIISKELQEKKINRWNVYWTEEKKQKLVAELLKAGTEFLFKPAAFARFEALLNKQYSPAGDKDFAAIKSAFGNEYLISSNQLQAIINAVKVEKADRIKLYAELQKNRTTVILDKQIITNKFIDIIYSDFNSILAYTSLLVFFALLFSYGRLELTIITFLPMLITWIWILGIMTIFGLKFNIINIIISTFIFGLGDDFSIFITDGLTRKFAEGKETIASHKVSIFLSAATTVIGLGALIFARHPALQSIALISIIGITCVLLIGQTIQPFLYNFFIQSRKDKGFAPWTFPSLALSVFAFSYYVLGSIILTLSGFILIYLLPFPDKKKRKRIFHYMVCKALKSLMYVMANVRKVYINKQQMDFSKPAVIIANHQSFLDILATVMQHPKLILLTNRWVYYSPVFGKVVQFADYYPVMEGVNPAIDKFEEIVKDGYSIVVFPEGTRSPDGQMKRFHKGAFYLAEKLNIDIVPLLLHGTGDTMGKGDFMLFNGTITMKYLPRISSGDKNFGEGYAERTKTISRYFKREFETLKQELEQPKYFKQRLVKNYIYKGPFLEFYTAIKLRKEKYYETIHNMIPTEGDITVLGCSYGFMNYMLGFLSSKRKITGIDINEEKIDVANNCYSKKEQLQFICADVLIRTFTPNDAFVIADMLHNFSEEQQTMLIKRLINSLSATGIIIIKTAYKDFPQIRMEKIKTLSEASGMSFSQMDQPYDVNNRIFAIRRK